MIVVLNLFDIVPGREAQYAEYLRRVQPILERYGAKVLVYGLTRAVHMANCSQEYCGVIAYPGLDELKALSHDAEFCEIRLLRDNSTENYILNTIEDFETLNHAATYLDARAIQEQRENPAASPGE